MTYLTLSPVQMTFHGIGSSISASHDQAALSALKQLSEQGLDPVDGPIKWWIIINLHLNLFVLQTSETSGRADGQQTD
ncbi:double-stranded RNA-binding protein Staufen homolog 2-like isoform X2 [Sinocyclocheilus rhinocerous]|uniref:double-stranded RNA-binding protein Staufen homolog 2-like isoform X2 n=1 Tax=Sinocyclocheilus rhinocerous TaxID=307959 RepID=UPI0007BA6083|nr:PREDICTED: double-stranded RNA-binding protein Staufen homolog 2-like isoform X2 [Sinocyclocheilus rhinocerous]